MGWVSMNFLGIDMEASCKRIGQMIDKSGMTDKELGRMMSLSVQAINKWRHSHSFPDIENLFILSQILGVKVDDFLVPRMPIVVEIEAKGTATAVPQVQRLWAYARLFGQNRMTVKN